MKKKAVVLIVLTAFLVLTFSTVCYADADVTRYQLLRSVKTGLTIRNGVADVTVDVTPATGTTLSYAVMTIELIKSSSGAAVQYWSGTYYPDSTGVISFGDSQSLYATGGYYVRVSGTAYAAGGAYDPFSATSATVTY